MRGQRQFGRHLRPGHIRRMGGIQPLGIAAAAHGLGHIQKDFHIAGQMIAVPGMQLMKERNGGDDDRRALTRQKTGQPRVGQGKPSTPPGVKGPAGRRPLRAKPER